MAKPSESALSYEREAEEALAWLKTHASKTVREDMAKRYGIVTSRALGVSMANIQVLAKRLGRSHELAAALWDTGWYEARLLTSFVDEPERVTAAQMDRWCNDFDNWGVCDTLCFNLFDRTPHAWAKIRKWSTRREEFVKRAAFALLASLAGHDKGSDDAPYLESLRWIERAATDERNFVKKGVLWAFRRVGGRSAATKSAAAKVARRLTDSPDAAARWVGRNALRDFDRGADD